MVLDEDDVEVEDKKKKQSKEIKNQNHRVKVQGQGKQGQRRQSTATMLRIALVKPGQIALMACSIIFGIIPTVAVILRLIARRIAHRKLDAADYLIFFAWVRWPGAFVLVAWLDYLLTVAV